MFESMYFSIFLTLTSYYIGLKISKSFKNPILNPMLIAMVICILTLKALNISYDSYMLGGSYILFFMGPATVALVIPLYKNINLVRSNFLPIIIGVVVGTITALLSIFLLCRIFGVSDIVEISLMPQSITTAIGLPLSENMGGIGGITIIAIMIRGIFGAIICVPLFKILKIKNKVAKGISIGTTSHVVGTSKAIEIGEEEGAMSGLSIVLCGVLTSLLLAVFS